MAEIDDFDPGGGWEQQGKASTGEQRLMLALIEDGVRTFIDRVDKKARWAEASDWIFARGLECSYRGVTFEYACAAVEIDPGYIRHQLAHRRPPAKRRHPRVNGSRHQIRAA